MFKRKWMAAMAVVVLGTATTAVAADLDKDVVVYQRGGEKTKSEGTIMEDDLTGVTVKAGVATFKIPRPEVLRIYYQKSSWSYYAKVAEAFEKNDFPYVIEHADKCVKASTGLPNEQLNLFRQHLIYYEAMSNYNLATATADKAARQKLLNAAREGFTKLLAIKADTAWFFEAKLTDAICLEEINPGMAVNQYKLILKEFKEKKDKVKWTPKYEMQAEMGIIRLDMGRQIEAKDTAQVTSLLNKLLDLQKTPEFEKFADADAKASAIRIEAMARLFLKQYKVLAEILSKAIARAYLTDDKPTLKQLYLNRADATFELAMQNKTEKNQAEAVKNFESALVDYMMADFTFDLPRADKAQANYRIGFIFKELQDNGKSWTDWQRKALRHLGIAAKNGSTDAAKLRSEIQGG